MPARIGLRSGIEIINRPNSHLLNEVEVMAAYNIQEENQKIFGDWYLGLGWNFGILF